MVLSQLLSHSCASSSSGTFPFVSSSPAQLSCSRLSVRSLSPYNSRPISASQKRAFHQFSTNRIMAASAGSLLEAGLKTYKLSELSDVELKGRRDRPRIDFSSIFKVGLQSFHQGVEKRYLTRAFHSGTENWQSSERRVWQSKIASLSKNPQVAAVRTFPWKKVYRRFVQRVLNLVWIVVKWLGIPALALSTMSELLYTLTAKRDMFIPLGILTGVLLAKIVGNASLDVVKELQEGRPWPLITMGMVFVLLKLSGPFYPSWAAAFLPHVANAGLVQTAFLLRDSHRMFV